MRSQRCERISRTERATASKRSRGRGRRRIDDVVEDEVPLVKRVAGPRELDRTASVLLEEMRKITASLDLWDSFFLFASSNDRKLLSRRFLILLPPEAEF